MNEPEGSVAIASDDEPCFDTKNVLQSSGAGYVLVLVACNCERVRAVKREPVALQFFE